MASDVNTYAQALYETLIGSALEQLRAAEPALSKVKPGAQDISKQVKAALPKHALPEVEKFLQVLVAEGVLDQLPAIIDAFAEYGQQEPTVSTVHVTSAVALSDEQKAHISKELNQRYKADLDIGFSVDETLIGGLIIRVGDQVLDNSLRSRLGSIQRNMLNT